MGTYLDVDNDLDVVWSGLMKEYAEITEQKLQPNANFEALRANIDQDLLASDSANKTKAKKILNRVGDCLLRFGDIVASAASIAFGPASQCWNAISFVINAAKASQAMLDGFVTLMERSMAFLESLSLFLKDKKGGPYLPPNLRKPTYEILGHFLQMLAHSHKVAKSKRAKIMAITKMVLFNDNSGVDTHLTKMEEMIKVLLHVEVDEILRDVKGLALYLHESDEERERHHAEIMKNLEQTDQNLQKAVAGVSRVELATDQLRANQERQISQQVHEAHLKAIKSAITVDTVDSWQEYHKRLQGSRVPGTGRWLERLPVFRDWRDRDAEDGLPNHALTLVAREGFGKAHICSALVDHLMENTRNSTHGQAHVVWYHFHQDTDGYSSVEECIGSLIYQLAALNSQYARAVAALCQATSGAGRAEQLWTRFIVELSSHLPGTYYVIINGYSKTGVEASAAEFMGKLSSLPGVRGASDVRILIASPDKDLGVAQYRIQLGVPSGEANLSRNDTGDANLSNRVVNEEDLQLMTQRYLETLSSNDAELGRMLRDPDLNAEFRLARGVAGDFKLLLSKLNEIKGAGTFKAIKNVVARADEDRLQTLARAITSLNDVLTAEELAELNVVLLWVLKGFALKSVKLLQTVVYLKTGEDYRLKEQISTIFSPLLRLDDQNDVVPIFSTGDMCKALAKDETPVAKAESSRDTVQKCEVDIVQYFLKANCSPELYRKLNFDQFFREKLNRRGSSLGIGRDSASHELLATTCLDILCEHSFKPCLEPAREYAAKWFLEHILSIDQEQVEFSTLRDLGGKIAKLLWDAPSIDQWWHDKSLHFLTLEWLEDTYCCDSLLKFLRLPEVAAGYKTAAESHVWLRDTISKIGDGNSLQLLSNVALRLATRWILSDRPSVDIFTSAERIMTKAWAEGPIDLIPTHEAPTLTQLGNFMVWIKERPQLKKITDSEWNLKEALVCVSNRTNHTLLRRADSLVRAGFEMDGGAQTRRLLAAYVCFNTGLFESCLQQLEAQDKLLGVPNKYHSRNVVQEHGDPTLYLLEARCHRELEARRLRYGEISQAELQDTSLAVPAYQEVIDLHPGFTSDGTNEAYEAEKIAAEAAKDELFSLWHKRSMHDHVLAEFFRHYKTNATTDELNYRLAELCDSEYTLDAVLHAAHAVHLQGQWQEVCRIYQFVADHCKQNPSFEKAKQASCLFDTEQALLKLHCSAEPTDRRHAITLLQSVLNASREEDGFSALRYRACRYLARAVLEDARVHEDYHEGNDSLRKLENLVEQFNDGNLYGPHLTLARYHVLAGNPQAAKTVLRQYIAKYLDDSIWQAVPGERSERYSELGKAMIVADCQHDAIAALHRYELELFQCTGGCREEMDEVDGMYFCKDCWSSQLCPACYESLTSGKLSAFECSAKHEHLFVPQKDYSKWRDLAEDETVVGGEVVKTSN
ncbi:hypothetical protein HII31_02563 [Pseudocercospora fuligena]|uniref:Fungal STAND N-terminal Goodbye domain-containing protein n=1 Tax=Pseudocercospora fuligena TaxID=685502 RepID=A0A8H6RSP5_9PEZI|nr:hypothetical protein HII31_02563 [Pseudocercospora fuligena]